MSIKLMSAVFDRYPGGGGELLLALAIADYANDDGESIFPSVLTLCHKTRLRERNVQYLLKKMCREGWLEVVSPGGGRGKTTRYRINPYWIKGANIAPFPEKGCNLQQERVQPSAPDPSVDPSPTTSPPKEGGKPWH